MKKVRNTTVMSSIFGIILRANQLGHNVSLGGAIVIILLSFFASILMVTISEMYRIDKNIAEDNNHISNPKTTLMEVNDNSL